MAQRSFRCQLSKVKKKSSKMIWSSNKLCMSLMKTQQKLERNTGQTAERKEDSLTQGVESNSEVENLLVPSDQGT